MDERELLGIAKLSKQTPSQSGFYVKTAGLTQSGKTVLGGNMEYGLCSAIHGEESVIANWAQACSLDDRISAIAFASEDVGPDSPWVTSCGNCRDLVREYCDPEGFFLDGNPDGLYRKYPFSKLFFDAFHQIDNIRRRVTSKAIESAVNAMQRSYDIYSGATYGASIITDSGVFSAGFEGDVAYHPTLPIRNAITCLKYASSEKGRFNTKQVVIAGPKALDVPYKDRQYLFEFVDGLRAGGIRKAPLEVYLIPATGADIQMEAWKTDSDEWLPFPFSPSVLGMDEKMKEYMARYLE